MEVKFNNVSFSYPGNKVLDDFFCNISDGISAIIGSTGSGKSTMLDLIDGLVFCDRGYVKVGSCLVSDNVRKSIGYLFQNSFDQVFGSSVYMEIELVLKHSNCSLIDSRIREVIKLVGLNESYLSRNPRELSCGERRKVALASILSYDPDIIILDEPTAYLDNRSKNDLIKLLVGLKKNYNKTIIIVSNDINFLHKFVDYVYLIRDGSIFLEGDKYSVLSNEYAMNSCGLKVPDVLHFSNLVSSKKGINIGYRDSINDLIKDVYRYAKW